MRRVITSEDDGGRSKITETVALEPLRAGFDWYGVWGWDELPTLPCEASGGYVPASVFPPPGGVRVSVISFPPGSGVGRPDKGSVIAEDAGELTRLQRSVPAGGERDRERGQHSTDTIDIGFVLSGEIELECEDESVSLRQGDVLIQIGALHAWRNRRSEECVMGFVLLGARRA